MLKTVAIYKIGQSMCILKLMNNYIWLVHLSHWFPRGSSDTGEHRGRDIVQTSLSMHDYGQFTNGSVSIIYIPVKSNLPFIIIFFCEYMMKKKKMNISTHSISSLRMQVWHLLTVYIVKSPVVYAIIDKYLILHN